MSPSRIAVAFILASALAAGSAHAAGVRLSATRVQRGHVVGVSGPAAGCRRQVIVVSAAFARSAPRTFGGKPAITAPVSAGHWHIRVRIAAATTRGSYDVIARCGGRTLGHVVLRVV